MSFALWLVFIPAVFVLNMAPGPNNMLAVSNAARFGWGRAVLGGLGRVPAFAILVGLTVVGLGTVLAASEQAFVILKTLGAAYLVVLGFRLWRAPVKAHLAEASFAGEEVALETPGLATIARREFLVAISNPKAILIFTAFFPQFLDASQPASGQLLVMGATFLVLESVALVLYAAGGAGAGRFLASAKGQRLFNRVTGGALISAGVALAFSRQHSS